ncbi:MAG TPA: septum formation initiator family protein [Acidimicrobiales bacterium]|nr:septum formation initiator family protein [Acidimicrobiales bacterium]
MIQIYRARIALVVAALFAGAMLVFELPVGEILHQRSEIAAVASELTAVQAHDAQLRSAVASLRKPPTIAAMAHQEYGLVRPGQRAYVVLPSAGSTAGQANTLAPRTIPEADLVPTDASSLLGAAPRGGGSAGGPSAGGSLWHRMVQRLEFWRWAF